MLSLKRLQGFWGSVALTCPMIVVIGLGAGCSNGQVAVSKVPKEKEIQPAHEQQASAPTLQFQAPAGWEQLPAGGMHAARFSVAGQGEQKAEVTVVPLSGITAGKADIVNLWRGQVRLPPVQEADLVSLKPEKVAIGADNGELYDMVSTEALIKDKDKIRIMVAMLAKGSTSWFFKMAGEDKLVTSQRQNFIGFLKSVQLGEGTPAVAQQNPQQASGMAAGQMPAGHPPVAARAKPTWQAPENWKEQPPTQMLVGKYSVGGETGKTEVTISSFPGDVGGLLANVNRWRSQLALPPVGQAELDKDVSQIDIAGGKATLVELTGTNPKSGAKARMVGVIVPRQAETWFFKMMGDEAITAQEKPAFLKFMQTVRFPHAG